MQSPYLLIPAQLQFTDAAQRLQAVLVKGQHREEPPLRGNCAQPFEVTGNILDVHGIPSSAGKDELQYSGPHHRCCGALEEVGEEEGDGLQGRHVD